MGRKPVAAYIEPYAKDKLRINAEKFGVRQSIILKDAIEAFTIHTDIPQEFLDRINIKFLMKTGMPVRAIPPYLATYAGLDVIGNFILSDTKNNKIKLEPYPEYSLICIMKMVEKLYMGLRAVNG